LALNEANRAYLELSGKQLFPHLARLTNFVTLYHTSTSIAVSEKNVCPTAAFPQFPHAFISQVSNFFHHLAKAFSSLNSFVVAMRKMVIRPSCLSDWGNCLNSLQLSMVGKYHYTNKSIFNIQA